jgi:hypothetical protein
LILQRRMRTRRSFSRWARLYGVELAPHHRLLTAIAPKTARLLSGITRARNQRSPRLVTGGFSVHFRPNTHVAAFSRSMMSNEATHNASAVPATHTTRVPSPPQSGCMSWNISRRDAAETNASPQPTRHKKNPRKPGSSVSGLGQLIFGALLSRFNRRKDQRGHKQPEQDRRDHQRERENHRGHSAHDPTEVNSKQTCRKTQSMSLLGAKRTWLCTAHVCL